MISNNNVIVVDIDGTLCAVKKQDESYADVVPDLQMVQRLRDMAEQGWRIVLYTARGMRTYEGNVGAINAEVLPVLLDWLNQHKVPYHEIHTGKPWPGKNGFYVDDRSVRPREFLEKSFEELEDICTRDRVI